MSRLPEVACVADSAGDSQMVEMVEQGNRKLAGGVEEVLEFHAFEAAFAL